jgi:hypothetical protein
MMLDIKKEAERRRIPWTEERALKILQKEITRWQGNNWTLAAHFLQWFIDKKGPTPYKYTDGDMCELIEESTHMIRKAIIRGMNGVNIGNVDPTGKAITYKGYVRWNPTFKENTTISSLAFVGTLLGEVNADIQASNNDLFYAYAGARLEVKGTVDDAVKDKGGNGYRFWVGATVTIKDNYTFHPTTFPRMEFLAYEAANWLETRMKNSPYKAFDTDVTFKDSYGPFRLNAELPAAPFQH